MVKKAVLARFIASGRHEVSEWRAFLPKVTGLRVKGVGSEGAVLISLDDSGWFTPSDWLANYRQTVSERLHQELKVAEAVLPPEKMEELLLQFTSHQESKGKFDIMDYVALAKAQELPEGKRAEMIINLLGEQLGMKDLGGQVFFVFRQTPYAKPKGKG